MNNNKAIKTFGKSNSFTRTISETAQSQNAFKQDVFGGGPNPFEATWLSNTAAVTAVSNENRPNGSTRIQTGLTESSHSRPTIERTRSMTISSSSGSFPPPPPAAITTEPNDVENNNRESANNAKKRNLTREPNNAASKSRKKTSPLDDAVSNGTREQIRFLKNKIDEYSDIIKCHERFHLRLPSSETDQSALITWLGSLGFSNSVDRPNIYSRDNLNELRSVVERCFPSAEPPSRPPALDLPRFTEFRNPVEDEDELVSQTPHSSRHEKCPDSTRSYIAPSPSTEILVSGMDGLKVGGKSPRSNDLQAISRPRSFTFGGDLASSSSSSKMSTLPLGKERSATITSLSTGIGAILPENSVALETISRDGEEEETHESVQKAMEEEEDGENDIRDDVSQTTASTVEDQIDDEVSADRNMEHVEEDVDEFASINSPAIAVEQNCTPTASPKAASRPVPPYPAPPNAARRSLTEPYLPKKDMVSSPTVFSQPTNYKADCTPITYFGEVEQFKRSEPASKDILIRLRAKFDQRCKEMAENPAYCPSASISKTGKTASFLLRQRSGSEETSVMGFSSAANPHHLPNNMAQSASVQKLRINDQDRSAMKSGSLMRDCLQNSNHSQGHARSLMYPSHSFNEKYSLGQEDDVLFGQAFINNRRGGGLHDRGLSTSMFGRPSSSGSLIDNPDLSACSMDNHLVGHFNQPHSGHHRWSGHSLQSLTDDHDHPRHAMQTNLSPDHHFNRMMHPDGTSSDPRRKFANTRKNSTSDDDDEEQEGDDVLGIGHPGERSVVPDKVKTRKKNRSFAKLKRLSLNFSSSFVLLSTSVASLSHHQDNSLSSYGDNVDQSQCGMIGNLSFERTHHQTDSHQFAEPPNSTYLQRKIHGRYSLSYRVCDSIVGNNQNDNDSSGNNLLNLSCSHAYSSAVKDFRRLPVIATEDFAKLAVIVGGNFHYNFDNHIPVVSPPEMADVRVVNVEYHSSDGSLTLELLNTSPTSDEPKKAKKNVKTKKLLPSKTASSSTVQVSLGAQWRWYNCSPIGYLVTDSWTTDSCDNYPHDGKKCIFYYLPKHPVKWNTFGDCSGALATAIPSPVAATAEDDSVHHIDANSHDDEDLMNCDESSIFDDDDEVIVDVDVAVNDPVMRADEDDEVEMTVENAVDEHNMFTQVAVVKEDDMKKKGNSSATAAHVPQSLMFRIMSFLTNKEVHTKLIRLNKCWTIAGFWYLLAQGLPMVSLAKPMNNETDDYKDQPSPNAISTEKLVEFLRHFPKGKFLSDGACKRVYCILSKCGALNALSIMDINDLNLRGVQHAIEQELRISILCSNLSIMNVCPNMIQVFSVFQTNADPSKQVWKCKDLFNQVKTISHHHSHHHQDKTLKHYATDKFTKGHYQMIRMEFCSGGDVESHLRTLKVFPCELIRSYLFQMCFALYSGRETLSLRHYDIKLLNFFVTNALTSSSVHASKVYAKGDNEMFGNDSRKEEKSGLQIGFGRHIYTLPIHLDLSPSLIKLADFGTSVIGQEILNEPITPHQFTTLENSPPEFLLLGSTARQSHTADTWCLGLCMLHMLTGEEPYEVLLKDVRCPPQLLTKLHKVWQVTSSREDSNPYCVIKDVIDTLDDEAEDEPDSPPVKEVLAHTLYRYLVLFAASPEFASGFVENDLYKKNDVWKVINDELDLYKMIDDIHHTGSKSGKNNHTTGNVGGTRGKAVNSKKTFEEHVRKFSIHQGSSEYMKRVRETLRKLGSGSEELLNSLLHWDPSQRCSMYDALHHPIFHAFREDDKAIQPVWSRYMYYYRHHEDGSNTLDGLPIF